MLVPILHRVLVKADKADEADEMIRRAKALGIHIELDKREQAAVETGTVIDFGSTAFRDYGLEVSPVLVGDRVYFAKYAGKLVKDVDGIEYIMLNDEDIICKIVVV